MEWIPVTERLPIRIAGQDTSARVLTVTPHGDIQINVASYEHQHKDFDYGGPKKPCFDGAGATHWMPLPPLPFNAAADPR